MSIVSEIQENLLKARGKLNPQMPICLFNVSYNYVPR